VNDNVAAAPGPIAIDVEGDAAVTLPDVAVNVYAPTLSRDKPLNEATPEAFVKTITCPLSVPVPVAIAKATGIPGTASDLASVAVTASVNGAPANPISGISEGRLFLVRRMASST